MLNELPVRLRLSPRHDADALASLTKVCLNARLVPAKPKTQPITNPIRERSDRTKSLRSRRTTSAAPASEPKASQAQRRRREPPSAPLMAQGSSLKRIFLNQALSFSELRQLGCVGRMMTS